MIEPIERPRYRGRPRKDPDQYVTDLTDTQREAGRQRQARYRARVRERDATAFLEKQRAASLKHYHKKRDHYRAKRALARAAVTGSVPDDASHDTAATGHNA